MFAFHSVSRPRIPVFLCAIPLFLAAACAIKPLPADLETVPLNAAEEMSTQTPEPTGEPTPNAVAVLQTQGGNLRSGPGMNYPVITVMARGESYPIVGRNEGSTWWQLCCVSDPADETGATPMTVWVAASIVDVEGDVASITGQVDKLDLGEPLFDEDFTARWNVKYRCDSERCEVAECAGEMDARVRNTLQNVWLEVERSVTWPEQCGDDTVARFQVNRYTGQDRYIGEGAAFFDRDRVGANPGEPVKFIPLADGQVVQAWCTGPRSLERQETENWTIVYDGEACYDVQTGMMLALVYSKSWLFSGVVDEQTYERAPGPVEYYDFELDSTNALLKGAD